MVIENSVIVVLGGRLGNILFQLAAGITYAKKYNRKLYLLVYDGGGWCQYYIFYHELLKKYDIITPSDIGMTSGVVIKEFEPSHQYFELPNIVGKNIMLDGYWQDVRYINFGLVLPELVCSNDRINSIKNRLNISNYDDYVFISIRHGIDYTKLGLGLSMDFFEKVYWKYFSDKIPIIATDDQLFVNKNLNLPNKIIIPECDNLFLSYENLYLGMLFKNQIISNSSYSIWGVYFQTSQDAKIVYPSNWFGVNSEIISMPTQSNWICEDAIFEKK